jgi:ribulose-phosphate 3-epimerase
MPVICPTITATDPHSYREQMARIEPFAGRVHIDFGDGEFTERMVNIAQAYWPDSMIADFHVMYKKPHAQLETIVSLKPNMTIIHAEADDDVLAMLLELQAVGIKAGLALLPKSQPQDYVEEISHADHILLFGGELGHQGGTADLTVLKKVGDIRAINPTVELGWDGGITAENTPTLVKAGIEVLNVGGFIHNADDPKEAYESIAKTFKQEQA